MFNSICIFSNDYDFIKSCLKLNIANTFVFVEKGKVEPKFQELITNYRSHFREIDKTSISIQVPDADIGMMFGFGIKLTSEIIGRHKHGIINAHPGNLKLFRGRHPIGWALIEREPEITLTFHKITKDFDLGLIVKEISIPVDELDTEYALIKKVRSYFTNSTFFDIFNSLAGENFQNVIESGRYLPSLAGKYDDILSEDFSSDTLVGISRAKYDYGGFLLNGQKVGLLFSKSNNILKKYLIGFKCADSLYVYTNGDGDVFVEKK